MMNMPYDQIVQMIEEKSTLSKEEIQKKIDDKLNQLSGLISKEGAAHIIANDLGINFPDVEKKVKIRDILAGMRNVETVGKVVQVYEIREFNRNGRDGKVANFLLGDDTGVIRIVLWNDQAEILKTLKEGMTVKVVSGYARSNNNRVEIHLNEQSKLEINPEGEEVADVRRSSFTRKKISELTDQDSDAEILGTIVQVFDPRFFEVDPSTGRRIRPSGDGKFYGQNGEEVQPDYSYVFNLFLDDGTDTIRAVCFRNQMQALLNKSHDEILVFKDNQGLFEPTKHDLLGQMVKVQGRVARNEMFDRLEFIASRIYPNPDPQEEMAKKDPSQSQQASASAAASTTSSSESNRSGSSAAASTAQPASAPEEPSSEESYTPPEEKPTPSSVGFESADEMSESLSSSSDASETEDYVASLDDLDEPKKEQTADDSSSDDDLGELEELDDLEEDI
ncbi:MAG: OB-fold nucleic acid binding domain-containing protein [Nanoarchaeota archaeon]